MRSALYDDRTLIGPRELEKILQTLLWTAGTLVLPSSVRVDPTLSDDEQRRVAFCLNALSTHGAVSLWTFADEVPGRQRLAQSWIDSEGTITHTLGRNSYDELYDVVRDGTDRYRVGLRHGAEGEVYGREGITEFVSLQSNLWGLGLARMLGSEGLIIPPERSTALERNVRKIASLLNVRDASITALMEIGGVRELQSLEMSDFWRLRRLSPSVQELIDDCVDRAIPLVGVDDAGTIARRAEGLVRNRLIDLGVSSAGRGVSTKPALARSWVCTIAGLLHPALSALSFLDPVLSRLGEDKRRSDVLLLLWKLRSASAQA